MIDMIVCFLDHWFDQSSRPEGSPISMAITCSPHLCKFGIAQDLQPGLTLREMEHFENTGPKIVIFRNQFLANPLPPFWKVTFSAFGHIPIADRFKITKSLCPTSRLCKAISSALAVIFCLHSMERKTKKQNRDKTNQGPDPTTFIQTSFQIILGWFRFPFVRNKLKPPGSSSCLTLPTGLSTGVFHNVQSELSNAPVLKCKLLKWPQSILFIFTLLWSPKKSSALFRTCVEMICKWNDWKLFGSQKSDLGARQTHHWPWLFARQPSVPFLGMALGTSSSGT